MGHVLRPLDATGLVTLSEQAGQMSGAQWSLALLRAANPHLSDTEILAMPIGVRDQGIIAARAGITSGPLRAEPVCDTCGATFELTLHPIEIGLQGREAPEPGYRTVKIDGVERNLRPITLADMLAVEQIADVEVATKMLKDRIVEGEENVDTGALESELEKLDPAANIWLTTACPDCEATQNLVFDPVHFVALEVRQAALRILQDVMDIARVFHWSERDILALPEYRRAIYVAAALA